MGLSQGHTGQALIRRLQHQLAHTNALTERHRLTCSASHSGYSLKQGEAQGGKKKKQCWKERT